MEWRTHAWHPPFFCLYKSTAYNVEKKYRNTATGPMDKKKYVTSQPKY